MLLGHRSHHVFARGIAELDDRLGQTGVLVFRDLASFVELILADNSFAQQDFRKITFASH